MDLGLSNTLLAGDPRLVDHIVGQVKSQGIFDQFRKECIADVDTKPAYQNLRTRVEGSVNSFLKSQAWKPDMNKNQLRETLRKNIHDASFLEVGVERIVDQVVNPKIYSVFMPQIEDVVYKFLGIERPKPRAKNGPCNLKDLLPKDLDPVSPESDRNSLKDESLESVDVSMGEHVNGRRENSIVENKPHTFEKVDDTKNVHEIKKVEENKKLEEMKKMEMIKRVEEINKIDGGNNVEENKRLEEAKRAEEIRKSEDTKKTEETKNGQLDVDENSMDVFDKSFTKTASASNLNVSFISDEKTEEEEESPQFEPIDIMNLNESNLSNDSHLSGISELTSHRSRSPIYSNEFSRDQFDLSNHDQDSQLSKVSSNSRLSIVTDFGSSNQASTSFPNANEDSKDRYSKDNFRAIRDIEEGKYKEDKFNFEALKNKDSPREKEKDSKSSRSLSSIENSRDEADSVSIEKSESSDTKEKSESRDLKEKSESRDGKEQSESRDGREKYESSKSRKDKSDSRDSRRHRDRKKQSSSSSSRHSKSRKERDQSREKRKDTPDKTKEVPSKAKEEKPKEERKDKEEKEKDEKKEKEEKKEPEKQEILQDIFKDLKDIYKEKIRELREKKELTEKEKLNKDLKTNKDPKEKRDSSRDKKNYKKEHKTSKSSDRHDKSSKTKSSDSKDSKDKKREDRRHYKESRSRSSKTEKESRVKKEGKSERSDIKKDAKSESQSSKEKKQRDDKKSKSKDDHSSLRKNSNDRRSTDRDGSNGSSSKSSQKNTSSATKSVTTALTKETSNTNNTSGDTSDGIEDSQDNDNKLVISEYENQQEINYKSSSTNFEYLYPERENTSKADGNSNETCLPLKKRPLYDDSSASFIGSPSDEPKVKKPKFAKNIHEAKRLMKIRKRMEKQNSEEGSAFKINKIRSEETESESLSNSPLPVEDITKVPDEERVQIIEVPDEECEEPYSAEVPSLTLEETEMIILQRKSVGQSDLMQNGYKESKLSLMEESIRKSLDEMMSDQKLAESNDAAVNAERTIETEAQKNLKVGETSEMRKNSSENHSDVKSARDKVEENLEKLEAGNFTLMDISEEDEITKLDKSLNSDFVKLESNDSTMKSDSSKIISEDEKHFKNLSPTMELRVSMGIKQSTEDLIRNVKTENSSSSQEYSPDIDRKSKRNRNEGDSEKNTERKGKMLLMNDKIEENREQGKEYPAALPLEEVCLYFQPDNERYLRFADFLASFEKKLISDKKVENFAKEKTKEDTEPEKMAPPKLKRKLSSSPLSDILLRNANNNNDGIKQRESKIQDEGELIEKNKKMGRPKKQRPSLSSFNTPGVLNGENFVMPLSPESDVSATSEKTSGQSVKEEKSRPRNNQRYSSDDLYKPRPLFSSSSRRNRRSNQA